MLDNLKHIPLTNTLLRRTPVMYSHAIRAITATADMDFDQLQAYQQAKIARMLTIARTLPGYRSCPASDELRDWPVLEKPDLLAREHLFTPRKGLAILKAGTGGTTGQPLQLRRSHYNVVFEQAAVDSLCQMTGANPAQARSAILRGDSINLPQNGEQEFWIDEGRRKRIYSAHHLSPSTAARYIASLREYSPDILFCYPSSLAALLVHIDRLDGLRVPLVVTSSEVLHADTLMQARDRLGCDLVDLYGHAERVAMAYAVNGRDYRFLPSYGHIELQPCGNGRAKIIATSLRPDGQVLIRYNTGDIALVGNADAEDLRRMELGLLPFNGIEGRDSEFIELPDGQRIIGLNHIPRGVSGAASVQLHHGAAETMDIYIVPGASFGAPTTRAILENFRAKFPAAIAVRLWSVDAPLREPNGKAPLLLRAPVIPADRRPVHATHGVPAAA